MLVLSRHVNEQIIIGDNIVITVVDIRGSGRVQLGIDAPKDVPVLRSEIYERIKRDGPQLEPPRETI